MRRFVQDKLVKHPPAIGKLLSASLNRHLNATERVAEFVHRVRQGMRQDEDLWLGFVDQAQLAQIKTLTGVDADGYLVLLPAHNVRHTAHGHKFDGQGQRPARPDDYRHILRLLNEADRMAPGSDRGKNGEPRVVAWKEVDGQLYRAVFEASTGRRNRAFKLISLTIKAPKE
ncbi:MAG: hypothetical protein Q4D74_10340 [Comamonadaceae bacterium]|nr:hypothetical protein [Comamonadaceae bacterium]